MEKCKYIEICEKGKYIPINETGVITQQGSAADMVARAKEGYFVRDIERDIVYCPAGCVLRPKCGKKDGSVRYYNKLACASCKKKCTVSKWKEIDFLPGKGEVMSKISKGLEAERPQRKRERKVVKSKKVEIVFRPDQKKLCKRMGLSEHPFGTIKRWHDGSYLLLKGIEKTTGELSLSFLIYNMKRAIRLLGMEKVIAEMG